MPTPSTANTSDCILYNCSPEISEIKSFYFIFHSLPGGQCATFLGLVYEPTVMWLVILSLCNVIPNVTHCEICSPQGQKTIQLMLCMCDCGEPWTAGMYTQR